LDVSIATSFIKRVMTAWETSLSLPRLDGEHLDFSDQTVDALWNCALSVFIDDAHQKYLTHSGSLARADDTDPPSPAKDDAALVTIQDERCFQFWLRELPPDLRPLEIGVLECSGQDVVALIEACNDADQLIDRPIVGKPKGLVWLTPKAGEIEHLIDEAEAFAKTGSAAALESRGIGSTIRNRLGLWGRRFPYAGVAVVLNRTYYDMLADKTVTLKAPTVLDAEGYDRFRHWPSPISVAGDAIGRGRTYELDPDIRRRSHPNDGAPEIVTTPRPFSEVNSLVYLGPFGPPPGSNPDDCRTSYAEFANDVAGGHPLSYIVQQLAARLGV
jgi:hypothetical protein